MNVYRRKYKDRQGRERTGKTWWLLCYVGGKRIHQTLRTKDRRAADLMAADIVRREELKRAGIVDPYGEHHERPLTEHLRDFEKTLRARGVVTKYLEDRMGCLRAYVEQTGVENLKDLSLPSASGFLSEIKATKVSARTVNRYYSALKQFGIWLVKTRRAQFDPFDGLKKLNEEADRRHVRRALTPEEAAQLVKAARERPLKYAEEKRIHAGVSPKERLRLTRLGEVRALIYMVALGTGMRRTEIRHLRWCDIDYDRGIIRVPAKSAKSRRDQTVALPERLAQELRTSMPVDAAGTDTVVPKGAFPNSMTFQADVKAAGIARKDAEGRVVDFHGLRHTFVTWLAVTGAHPKTAQTLARHASIETTMERYTDLTLIDMGDTVDRLPLPEAKRRRGRPVAVPTWNRRGDEARRRRVE